MSDIPSYSKDGDIRSAHDPEAFDCLLGGRVARGRRRPEIDKEVVSECEVDAGPVHVLEDGGV